MIFTKEGRERIMRKILFYIGAAVVMTAAFFVFSACQNSTHYHCWKETVYVAATCETDGEKVFLCDCGAQKPRKENAVGHQLTLIPKKEPTCAEDGYAAYHVCNQCDYTEKNVLTATGEHIWNEGEKIGDVWKFVCLKCEKIKTKADEGHTHVFDEGEIAKEPTCAEEGVMTYACICGETKEESITKTNEHIKEVVQGIPATCLKEGKTEGEKCSVCDVYTIEPTVIEKLQHSWNSGEWGAAVGEKLYTCTVCGERRTGIPEGHTHVFDEWSILTEANCLEKGEKIGSCVCGETKKEKISELGHTEEEATCLDDAFCGRCGVVVATALEHMGGEATCLSGEICSRCGEEYGERVDCSGGNATCTAAPICQWCHTAYNKALGHSYKNGACERCFQPQPVLGAELAYEFDSGKGYYVCTGLKNSNEVCRKIVVPDEYADKPVGEIASAAFENHYGLISVEIGANVQTIGQGAFLNCHNLFEITVKSSAISVEKSAYENNGYLAYYARSINPALGQSKIFEDAKGYVTYKDGQDCVLLGYTGAETKLTLPEGITVVAPYVLSLIPNLTEVTLSDSVELIRWRAFSNCQTLKKITFGTGVKEIEKKAFQYFSALESAVFKQPVGWWREIATKQPNGEWVRSKVDVSERAMSDEKEAAKQLLEFAEDVNANPSWGRD